MGWLSFLIASMLLNTLFLAPDLHQSFLMMKGLWNFKAGTFYAGRRILLVIPFNLLLLIVINRIKGKREVYELLPSNTYFRFGIYTFLILGTYYLGTPQTSGFLYGRF